MPALRQSPLFEGLHRKFVLGMVTGSRREFDIAQLLQLPPHGGLIERDRKFLAEPLDQIDQPPPHDTMDRRDRAALDDLHKRLTLRIIEPGPGAGSFAIQEAIRATSIEPDHPPEPVEGPARSASPPPRSSPPRYGSRRPVSMPTPTDAAPGSRSSSHATIAATTPRQNPPASRSHIPWSCPPMKGTIDSDF